MDVSSVSSSINSALAASLQSPARTRAAEQDQQAQQPTPLQSSQPAQRSQAVQGAAGTQESSSSNERQAQAQADVEKSRPTVNLNGQTVGARVNTTA